MGKQQNNKGTKGTTVRKDPNRPTKAGKNSRSGGKHQGASGHSLAPVPAALPNKSHDQHNNRQNGRPVTTKRVTAPHRIKPEEQPATVRTIESEKQLAVFREMRHVAALAHPAVTALRQGTPAYKFALAYLAARRDVRSNEECIDAHQVADKMALDQLNGVELHDVGAINKGRAVAKKALNESFPMVHQAMLTDERAALEALHVELVS